MTVENKTISALVDGEASFAEGTRWLDEAAARNEVSQTAARYQLIGACMRGDSALDTSGLFERIRSQIDDEPTILAPAALKPAMTTGVKKTAAGFAVAASIAAAVVFTVLQPPIPGAPVIAETPAQLEGQKLSNGATLVSNRAAGMDIPRQQEIPQVDIDTGNPDLDRYLRQHQDYIGSGTFGPGFATATMVSYDGR